MKHLLQSSWVYPGLVASAPFVSHLVYQQTGSVPLSVTAVTVGYAVLTAILELVNPYEQAWKTTRNQFLVDLFHSLVSSNGTAQLVRFLFIGYIAAAGAWLATKIGLGLWPAELPMVLQLLLAVLLCDFGAYWAHRSLHLTEWGWRAHSLHHSAEKMHFLASGRTHPFNAAIVHTAELGIIMFLGAGAELIALWTVTKAVNGIVQHSNVDLRPGIFNRLLATNEAHWWHHQQDWTPSNSNFGNTTMIWDQLFGTYYMPAGERPTKDVGLDDASIPNSLVAHYGLPFTLRTRYQPRERSATG